MDIPSFPGKDDGNFLVNRPSATLSDSFPLQCEVRVGKKERKRKKEVGRA